MKEVTQDRLKAQLADFSRKLADLTAHAIYDNPALYGDLVTLVLEDKSPHSERAARVLSICTLQYPELMKVYRKKIIRSLSSLHNIGVIRSLLKIYAEIPEPYTSVERSILMNLCFDLLSSPDTPVALQVYSMEILFRITQKIPELRSELYFVIDRQMPYASAGYKSRGKKILKKLTRE